MGELTWSQWTYVSHFFPLETLFRDSVASGNCRGRTCFVRHFLEFSFCLLLLGIVLPCKLLVWNHYLRLSCLRHPFSTPVTFL